MHVLSKTLADLKHSEESGIIETMLFNMEKSMGMFINPSKIIITSQLPPIANNCFATSGVIRFLKNNLQLIHDICSGFIPKFPSINAIEA